MGRSNLDGSVKQDEGIVIRKGLTIQRADALRRVRYELCEDDGAYNEAKAYCGNEGPVATERTSRNNCHDMWDREVESTVVACHMRRRDAVGGLLMVRWDGMVGCS